MTTTEEVLEAMVRAFSDDPYTSTSITTSEDGDEREVTLGEFQIGRGLRAALLAAEEKGWRMVPVDDVLRAIADERLTDNTGEEADDAYNAAIEHALEAAKAMLSAAPKLTE